VVEEARAAGIEHFIFVTGPNKGVIEDHFGKQIELERALEKLGKKAELEMLTAGLPNPGQTSFTIQQEPLGLGHAVWCARDLAGDEPFALLLPDVLVQADGKGCLGQLLDQYRRTPGNVLAVEKVPDDATHQYGIADIERGEGRSHRIKGMVEKPAPGTAPSNYSIMGRYLLQPEIFGILEARERGAGGEIQLTDAMITLLASQPFTAVEYQGRSFDCGSKTGFLAANIAFALEREDLREALLAEIRKLI
ncbi:MAG: UTP--glucose-1-phosphate uridylyltransferase, partial [Methyloligellaceae bacterium]